MNRALRRISFAVLAMFVLLLINVNYLQGFAGQPGHQAGQRPGLRCAVFQYQRGSIVTF